MSINRIDYQHYQPGTARAAGESDGRSNVRPIVQVVPTPREGLGYTGSGTLQYQRDVLLAVELHDELVNMVELLVGHCEAANLEAAARALLARAKP